MRRPVSTIAALATTLLMLAAIAPGVTAQDEQPAGFGDHPLVGVWIVDVAPDDPTNQPNLNVFSPGGYTIDRTPVSTGVGPWAPTGERSADITIRYPEVDDEAGFLGWFTVRASVEVAEDGQTFSGTATLEFPTPGGGSTGQLGPAPLSGVRAALEPMGEPVGPLGPPPEE